VARRYPPVLTRRGAAVLAAVLLVVLAPTVRLGTDVVRALRAPESTARVVEVVDARCGGRTRYDCWRTAAVTYQRDGRSVTGPVRGGPHTARSSDPDCRALLATSFTVQVPPGARPVTATETAGQGFFATLGAAASALVLRLLWQRVPAVQRRQRGRRRRRGQRRRRATLRARSSPAGRADRLPPAPDDAGPPRTRRPSSHGWS
jgi:hypothetical protein